MDVTCMDSCTSVQFTFVSSASAVHHNYVVTLYEHFIRDFYVHFKGTRTNICVAFPPRNQRSAWIDPGRVLSPDTNACCR
jgi:hypothetical protein